MDTSMEQPRHKAYISFTRNNNEDIVCAGKIASSISYSYPPPMYICERERDNEHARTEEDWDALRHAEYLIVVCSKFSSNDIEVNKEVEFFLHRHERVGFEKIISVIINGTPFAAHESTPWYRYEKDGECLPPALRDEYFNNSVLFIYLAGFFEERLKLKKALEIEMLSAIDREKRHNADEIRRITDEKETLRQEYKRLREILEKVILRQEQERLLKEEYMPDKHLTRAYQQLEEMQREIDREKRHIAEETRRIALEKEILRQEHERLREEKESMEANEPGITYIPRSKTRNQFNIFERINKKGAKNVYSSVFAPSEVKRDSQMLVQVYLHLAKETEMVKDLATESQSTAQRRDYTPLQCKLLKGDQLKVKLTVSEMNILHEDCKELIWMGSFTKCSFEFLVPHKMRTDELCCSILVSIGDYPIGEMKFVTKIVPYPRKLNSKVLTKQFQKVFISYSHEDSKNVQFVAKAYKALGIKYFFDSDNLVGGDIFEKKIMDNIDSSDLFILCWSKNAAKSDFIPKEIDRALMRAEPQKSMLEASIKIFPISIEPHASLPNKMADKYHFEVLS